jgi:CYTH domain-containing protein
MEIERKFLVRALPPELADYPSAEIRQAYLSFTPEIRVRKMGERFFRTEKGLGTLARKEAEWEISAAEYLAGEQARISNVIEKNRTRIPLADGQTAELDVFSGKLRGLLLVEVEFSSREAAERFLTPVWFGDEVTELECFKNRRLSLLERWEG